ncbi:MAG: hypothetical protein ABII09_08090 [Planctomycetota bacterium]
MTPKPTGTRKLSKREYLEAIAKETAKMSYPGHMNPIVEEGTKVKLEEYFVSNFPIEELWDGKSIAYTDYEKWHEKQTKMISENVVRDMLKEKEEPYHKDAVSAKFLNTFMHQLMKREKFRGLYKHLHLTLDNGVLKKECVRQRLESNITNAYKMNYETYKSIQEGLRDVLKDYNKKLEGTGIKLRSRIDLNAVLWALEAKEKKRKN